ncbi:uncharacterized protein LOC117470123 isoform X2 [Trematomus bernacchii]|uniref:uncharacterized protein LOC117470123 isoform X2 n=1 Tax=Trematomus bernacchii TaxID=40690 RepID=UPI00146D9E30|nr:uncharacterized protein LOC117470123 isoform X2 [Trematomus bernacchii]
MVMSMQSDQPMELPPPVKRPDPPSRERLRSRERGPFSPRQVVLPWEPEPIISREDLREPGPNIFSRSNPEKERAGSPAPSCVSMMSAHSKDPPLSFKQERLRSRERGPFSPRSEMVMSMQSDRPMELLRPFKLPDQPSRQYVSPLEPRPQLFPRSESMMSMQSDRPMELPPPVKRPDPPSISNPEKISAGSPASSCVSMMSARSMDFPLSFKGLLFLVGVRTSFIFCGLLFLVGVRTSFIIPSFLTILFTMGGLEEAVRSLKLQVEANERAEEESEDSLLRLWIMKLLLNLLVGVRTSFIFCGSLTILFTMGGLEEAVRSLKLQVEANERQKAGSPAPSLSVESDRSRTPPLNFSDEPGPSDTKDRGIDAGPCTDLNYRDSHFQNYMNMLERQKGISEDHTGLPENN